jgi:hypothetical protein
VIIQRAAVWFAQRLPVVKMQDAQLSAFGPFSGKFYPSVDCAYFVYIKKMNKANIKYYD